MISNFVIAIELILAGLLGLLAYRVFSLRYSQPLVLTSDKVPTTDKVLTKDRVPMTDDRPAPGLFTSDESPPRSVISHLFAQDKRASPSQARAELITRLHIIWSLQDRDCRENGLILAVAPTPIKGYAMVWFYGAACALSNSAKRHSEAVAATTAQLIGRKLEVGDIAAHQMLADFSRCSTKLACFRNGLEGAEFWSMNRFVPRQNSLYATVTSHAFL